VYVKSDGYLYYLDSSGVERRWYPPIVDNNVAYQGKDSGGTARSIAKVNSSNVLEIGDSNISFARMNSKIKGQFKVIQNQVITSPTTTITFSGLDGDTDVFYKIFFFVYNNSGTSNYLALRFNDNSGANYNERESYFDGTSVVTGNTTGKTELNVCYLLNGNYATGEVTIFAKSGVKRNMFSIAHQKIDSSNAQIFNSGTWTNTSSNITSITLFGLSSNIITSGYIYLMALQP
jgi:hypothetical protein